MMNVFKRRSMENNSNRTARAQRASRNDHWARVGMQLTFRAELMPGRARAERTFIVAQALENGRVELKDLSGQHAEQEFEPSAP